MNALPERRESIASKREERAFALETLYASNDVAPAPQPAFTNGTTVAGKYEVERLLAEGGMGVVVLAKHVALQQRVAIKYLKPKALGNADAVERFLREARLAAKLASEHVVRVHDVGTLPDAGPFMVMEYLVGESLGELVERGPLPVAEAVDYILQACDALAEAHALDVVHRDIKPDNLFLARRASNTPIIKVIDFGISKMGAARGEARMEQPIQQTATNERFGTPLYMSPEQLRSTADVDARTDIWSIGVVLHELLTGSLPFPGTDIPQLCTSILTAPPRRLTAHRAGAPRELEAVLLRCLEKDPAARYRNVGELAQELLRFGPASALARVVRIQAVVRDGGHSIRPPTPFPSPVFAAVASSSSSTLYGSELLREEPSDAAIHAMMRRSGRLGRRLGMMGLAAVGACAVVSAYALFADDGAPVPAVAATPPQAPLAPVAPLGLDARPSRPGSPARAAASSGAPPSGSARAKALPLRPAASGSPPASSAEAAKRRAMFGERE